MSDETTPTAEELRAKAFLGVTLDAPLERWEEAFDASYLAWKRGESIEMFKAEYDRWLLTGEPFADARPATKQ